MEDFLDRVRMHVDARAPHLAGLFDVMAGEARFARAWLDEDLRQLQKATPILEIGGGVFLLACQLAREGRHVTVIEPIGTGFGSFAELGAMVLALAADEGAQPTLARCKAEDFESALRFEMAFSVNVMEHVESPERVIRRVAAVLLPGGTYRFLCPNYLFPYEPHFNFMTAGSKALTGRLMRGRIVRATSLGDPEGVWDSLNWITVPKVRRIAREERTLSISFSTGTFVRMLERAVSDAGFARRRSRWMVAGIRMLGSLRLLHLATLIPATCQPIMDVRLTRTH